MFRKIVSSLILYVMAIGLLSAIAPAIAPLVWLVSIAFFIALALSDWKVGHEEE